MRICVIVGNNDEIGFKFKNVLRVVAIALAAADVGGRSRERAARLR